MRKGQLTNILSACISFLLVLAVVQSAVATEAQKDVSSEINDLRNTVTSADIYTIPASWEARHQLHEWEVVGSSCHYTVSERQDLDTLIDMLTNAQFTQRPLSVWRFDARTVIHLHQGTGSVISLVLSGEYSNAATVGTFRGSVPVTARMGFGASLLAWKKLHTPTHPEVLMCYEPPPKSD